MSHIPVLLDEVVSYWSQPQTGIFFDCTFGRGGHSQALLKLIDQKSQLFGLDIDQAAIIAGEKLAASDPRFQIIKTNFRNLKKTMHEWSIPLINGLLFDFGVSSPQLDDLDRGFSYHASSQLDMRMDQNQSQTAWNLLNHADQKELAQIFSWYGESSFAFQVAQTVVQFRQNQPINTTEEFVQIIKAALPVRLLHQKKHPARVFFQALRIAVNDELNAIKEVLTQLESVVAKQGIVIFLTFHSLEEKIIKHWIKKNCGYLDLPNVPIQTPNKFSLLTKKPIQPTTKEVEANHRSRSTKMWVVQRN